MNREIKFNFWQKSTQTMLKWDDYIEYGIFEMFKGDDSIPLQFTGLTDKNGKEIYEGDIFKYTKHEGYLIESFIAEIRHIKSYACFGYLKLGLNEFGFDHVVIHPFAEHDEFQLDILPHIEIIGNIYENPELL